MMMMFNFHWNYKCGFWSSRGKNVTWIFILWGFVYWHIKKKHLVHDAHASELNVIEGWEELIPKIILANLVVQVHFAVIYKTGNLFLS